MSSRTTARAILKAAAVLACAVGAAGTRPAAARAAEPAHAEPAGASGLKHGILWYSRAPDDRVRGLAAQRYSVGIAGRGDPSDSDKLFIKSHRPDFRWFVYNSATDNYVVPHPIAPEEHNLLTSMAIQRGWNPDEAYMHYYDDTVVALDGDTLLVPGWGGGSAPTPAPARIPVYYQDASRRLTHFSTRRAAQLQKELIIHLALDLPFQSSNVYADGIFLDNAASVLYNYGVILSGGHVREAPGHALIGSPEFRDWHWNNDLGPFLTALKDSLESSSSWSRDRKRKYLMVNVANIWDDSYVSRDVADVLFLEYLYNPVRSVGLDAVDEAHRRDVLAASAGITSFYPAVVWRAVPGREASFTYGETLLHNLVWYLVTRTPNTLFFQMETSLPSAAGWDSLAWRGCMDVANDQLGTALGEPYTLAQGVDPLGNRYVVKARDYQNGVAVLRNRGNWNEGIEPETAVSVPLPRTLLRVAPSGAIGGPVSEIRLRNGQGELLLNSGVPLAYTLTVTSVGSGSVRRDPAHASYAPGTTVGLLAVPALGWRFARWEGGLGGSANPTSVRMDGSKGITAVFVRNDPPAAADDAYGVDVNTTLQIAPPGVLANDRDPNADPLGLALRARPRFGSVTLFPDGSFYYAPRVNYRGPDSFTYVVSDGHGGTDIATVTLSVGSPTAILIRQAQGGGSSASLSVATSQPLDPAPGDLYLAAISTKPYRAVSAVGGLGTSWTRVRTQCSGRGQTGVEIWMARAPVRPEAVTATFADAPVSAVIVACRYSNAAAASIGQIVSGNTNGVQGTCSGGTDGASYSFSLTSTTPGGAVFAAVARRNKSTTSALGYTLRTEMRQGSSGDEVSLSTMDHGTSGGSAPLAGTLSGVTDWAVVGVEILPAAATTRPVADAGATDGLLGLRIFPNPAPAGAAISYSLPGNATVRIAVHDAAGRRIRTLLAGPQSAGSRQVSWDGRDDAGRQAPAGVYFVHFETGQRTLSGKLVLQR